MSVQPAFPYQGRLLNYLDSQNPLLYCIPCFTIPSFLASSPFFFFFLFVVLRFDLCIFVWQTDVLSLLSFRAPVPGDGCGWWHWVFRLPVLFLCYILVNATFQEGPAGTFVSPGATDGLEFDGPSSGLIQLLEMKW